MITIKDIDIETNKQVERFSSLLKIFNFKINQDKLTVKDNSTRSTCRKQCEDIIKDYVIDFSDFFDDVKDFCKEYTDYNQVDLDYIIGVHKNRVENSVTSNINILKRKYQNNLKIIQLRSSKQIWSDYIYNLDVVKDSGDRNVKFLDKFRKDVRKCLIDLVNDVVVVYYYKQGFSKGYTINEDGEKSKTFLLKDYLRGSVRDDIFHPNAKSLANIEDL